METPLSNAGSSPGNCVQLSGKTRLCYSWDPPLTSANATSHPFRMPASYSLCSGVERIKKLRIWHTYGSAADDMACCSAYGANPEENRPARKGESHNERRAAGGFTRDARSRCGVKTVDERTSIRHAQQDLTCEAGFSAGMGLAIDPGIPPLDQCAVTGNPARQFFYQCRIGCHSHGRVRQLHSRSVQGFDETPHARYGFIESS